MATDPRELEKMDMEVVMSTENGRRVMYRQLVSAGLYRLSFSMGDQDANACIFREGQRNTGLKLLAELEELVPDLAIKMMGENRNVT